MFGSEALSLLEDIGRRIRAEAGEPQFFQLLLQGVSVAIQRSRERRIGVGHGTPDWQCPPEVTCIWRSVIWLYYIVSHNYLIRGLGIDAFKKYKTAWLGEWFLASWNNAIKLTQWSDSYADSGTPGQTWSGNMGKPSVHSLKLQS